LPRVGILGGAFNPPHLGHLVCAQEAFAQLGLERVVLMPVGQAPHRTLEGDPGANARLEMAELAIAGDERLATSRMELDREGPSYTSETLRLLREHAPGDEPVLILGGDQAASLPSWHEPESVLALAEVAVVERVSWSRQAVAERLAGLPGGDRLKFVDMPLLEISSSDVRRRVAEGRPVRYLVPDAVGGYIDAHGLYASGVALR